MNNYGVHKKKFIYANENTGGKNYWEKKLTYWKIIFPRDTVNWKRASLLKLFGKVAGGRNRPEKGFSSPSPISRTLVFAKTSDKPPSKRLANFRLVSIDFSRGFGRNHLSASSGGEGSLRGIPCTNGGYDGHLYACAHAIDRRHNLARDHFQTIDHFITRGRTTRKKGTVKIGISNKGFIWSGFVGGVKPDCKGEDGIYTSRLLNQAVKFRNVISEQCTRDWIRVLWELSVKITNNSN